MTVSKEKRSKATNTDVGSEAETWWGDINKNTNPHFKKSNCSEK